MNSNYKSSLRAIGLVFVCVIFVGGAPADLDPTFGNGGKVVTPGIGGISDIAIQPDGKIVAVGGPRLVRYNANGSLDSSFSGSGIITIQLGDNTSGFFTSVAIQADGKIVVAGGSHNAVTGYGIAVVRYNPNGTLDTAFNGSGIVITPVGTNYGRASGIAIQADGKMVVTAYIYNGTALNAAVFRYNSGGSLDPSFNGTGSIITTNSSFASSVAIQQDGRIVVAGADDSQFTIRRFNTGGSPDTSFGGTGRVVVTFEGLMGSAHYLAIQADGRIVAKGVIGDGETFWAALLVRFNQDGSTDTTFGSNGIVAEPYEVNTEFAGDVAIQPDSKIVTVGRLLNDNFNFAVRRYNSNGVSDQTFNDGEPATTDFGFRDSSWAVALQADGKIVAAGYSASNQIYNFALARYQGGSTSRTRFDFDGDGRADVSVFRPSDRVWYLNKSTDGFSATQFGLPTDKITPADYDGDGRTDISVYRDGTWYWLNSSDNSFRTRQFGIASDIPVPADYYEGSGRSELAVYRNGTWWILNLSNNQATTIQFGLAKDKPVVGDYDGDGRADQAVYRNGEWHLRRSTQGYWSFNWGLGTDKPVPEDYDGDGKTDLAVYRDGTWYLMQTTQGWLEIQWGIATDIPAPADYDGDGKADAAVYREGTWYLRRSASSVSVLQFGLPNDKPVPSAYLSH